jgi:hypothetical protein
LTVVVETPDRLDGEAEYSTIRALPDCHPETGVTGRQFFHGRGDDDETDEDDWLDLLQDAVVACVEADSPVGPLGLRPGVPAAPGSSVPVVL